MIIVTGVSRGLGKAIVELYLSKGEKVLGIGRSHSFNHENFSFLNCDLSNLNEAENLKFPQFDTSHITLINNAGILGSIQRISSKYQPGFDKVINVNLIAPSILLKKVYARIENKDLFTLVNISSGAANRSIPAWSEYCASKAALNRYTESFLIEEGELGRSPRVYCVAPGVIDTDMQGEIRSSDKHEFSGLENFVDMKENSVLFSADDAAARLHNLLNSNYESQLHYDLRNF